jgi:methylated-DNA-[protein]-cysteine S-methyltransferase
MKPQTEKIFHHTFYTRFGPVVLLWARSGDHVKVSRLWLSTSEMPAGENLKRIVPFSKALSCHDVDRLAGLIKAFLMGDDVSFSLEMVRLDLCSEFQRRVLIAENSIPRGSVSTYQRIAVYLGKPKAARAVGKALAGNPFPLIIPCHRAIRSDGNLGGYQGGLEMKRALLKQEGIEFSKAGKMVTNTSYYGAFSCTLG